MNKTDIKILTLISGDIPLTLDPYEYMASILGISRDTLLERLKILSATGKLKRIAPILYHHKTPYEFNAMTVWIIPEDKIEDVSNNFSKEPSLSHVYERSITKDWPYNVYGMAHTTSQEEMTQLIQRLKIITDNAPHKVIYTKKEWKKTSPDLKSLLHEQIL